jgi:hypothetical protein
MGRIISWRPSGITPDPLCRFEQYFTQLLPWTKGSVMTLIQGYWSKVKVTAHNVLNIVRAIIFY